MSTFARFRTLFVNLATASSSVGLLASCSSIGPEDFETSACGDVLEGVTPGTAVDYLELRSTRYSDDDPWFNADATRGARCAGATDKAKCEATYAGLKGKGARWPKGIDHTEGRYLVYTRGDEVGTVESIDALRQFLKPFDNAKDGALLLEHFTEHTVPCDGANVRRAGSSFEFRTETGYACGEGTHRDAHVVAIDEAGAVSIKESERIEDGSPNCAIGRRPEGYAPSATPHSVGEYLAVAAELEAASIPAFRRLARELEFHGAPGALVARAERAARDEVQHARMMRRLALRFGATPARPRVAKLRVRSLVEVALENAREGCVRETFGAAVATLQASRATDAEIREAMERIAWDETEHAALAWDIAAWLDAKLDAAARAEVERAREEASSEVEASLRSSFASPELGVPSAEDVRALFESVAQELLRVGA